MLCLYYYIVYRVITRQHEKQWSLVRIRVGHEHMCSWSRIPRTEHGLSNRYKKCHTGIINVMESDYSVRKRRSLPIDWKEIIDVCVKWLEIWNSCAIIVRCRSRWFVVWRLIVKKKLCHSCTTKPRNDGESTYAFLAYSFRKHILIAARFGFFFSCEYRVKIT